MVRKNASAESRQQKSTEKPPSYEDTMQGGQGAPPTYYTSPPTLDTAPPQQVREVRVVCLPAPDFGPQPVRTVCPTCQAGVVTATASKPSGLAWAVSAVLCCTMLWPCFCLPFCLDSMQTVKHSCPRCKATLGRYRAMF